MIRLGAALITGLILAGGLAGVAAALTESAADDFSSGGYGGSTGTLDWQGNWVEVGESNGSGAGSVRVHSDGKCASGDCLTIEQLLGLGSMGAMRSLDLSHAAEATLDYHVSFPGGLLLDGTAAVDVRTGSGWQQLASHGIRTEGHHRVDLPVGEVVTIRFRAVDLSLTAALAFDDVEVEVQYPDPTTTTTSTSTSTLRPSTTTTTTAGAPTSTTTTRRSTTTTTTGADEGATGPDRDPGPKGTTSSTPPPDRDDTDDSTTTTVDPEPGPTTTTTSTEPGERADGRFGSGEVVTGLGPYLARDWDVEAQEDLLVVFGLAVEDIVLDILASAVLGLVLAWASLRRLG